MDKKLDKYVKVFQVLVRRIVTGIQNQENCKGFSCQPISFYKSTSPAASMELQKKREKEIKLATDFTDYTVFLTGLTGDTNDGVVQESK